MSVSLKKRLAGLLNRRGSYVLLHPGQRDLNEMLIRYYRHQTGLGHGGTRRCSSTGGKTDEWLLRRER